MNLFGEKMILSKIQDKLKTLKDFKISLSQKTFQKSDLISETKGFLFVSKPDKLRLQIDAPEDEKSILVANQNEIQAYHPGLSETLPGTLTIFETKNNPAKIWFSLFQGDLSQFTVSQTGNKITLVPNDSSGEVAQVVATVASNYLFKSISISYKTGNRAEFEFDEFFEKGDFGNLYKIQAPKNTKVEKIKANDLKKDLNG